MATLNLCILTKCLFCTLLTFKYIHFAQHTMTSCAPANRQKDWSLSKPKKSRTRTNASPTEVGLGPQSSPKSVQSSPVLSLSLVLGLDFQTLVIPGNFHWESLPNPLLCTSSLHDELLNMPKVKTNHGKAQTISCPRCGKKFCSEMNVLQHMNQPISVCHVLWHEEEHTHPLHQLSEPHQNHCMENEAGGIPKTDFSPGHWMPPGNQDDNHSTSGTFGTAGNLFDQGEAAPVKFTGAYKGCSEVFPGGETFMDTFQMDQYAEERTANVYFPFASCKEWQFAS